MGLMEIIQSGKQATPPRIVLYGTEGVGKSTLAANAPRPIFIQTEDGLNEIACDKFPLAQSYGDVMSAIRELTCQEHAYQTVVVDSLDWLERLIWDVVCREQDKPVKSIEDIGYQKGYKQAVTQWGEFLNALNDLRLIKGMAVILIAHAQVETFEDPEAPAYDRYSPRLHKHAQALVTEWADAVLFATRRIRMQKDGKGFQERVTAVGIGADGGERILRTVGGPACIAKNRYNLPFELPLSWPALFAGITRETNTQEGEVAHV